MVYLNYLDEIEFDLSVFHRVDDYEAMDSRKFWRFATRLIDVQGSLRARVERESEDSTSGHSDSETTNSDVTAALLDSSMADLFSYTTAPLEGG